MKKILLTTLLLSLILCTPTSAAKIKKAADVPVIASCDLLVVGGSLDACFLAKEMAENGKKVILTTPHNNLPREIAVALRPWVYKKDLENKSKEVAQFLKDCRQADFEGGFLLNLLSVTEKMENLLLDSGAKFYYGMRPCAVLQSTGLREQKAVGGVMFACKGGLVAIKAKTVVDATPHATVAVLAGAKFSNRETKNGKIRYSMLCKNVPDGKDRSFKMHSPHYAEFICDLPPASDPFCDAKNGLKARTEAIKQIMELGKSGKSQFSRGGDIVLASPRKKLVAQGMGTKVEAMRPREIHNLYVLSPLMNVADDAAESLLDPVAGIMLYEELAAALMKMPPPPATIQDGAALQAGFSHTSETLEKGEANYDAILPLFEALTLNCEIPPTLAECDVLVVGAGTSGLPAAMAADAQGADTILLEMHGDLGGTHTIGGVSKYWFGRKTPYFNEFDEELRKLQATGMPRTLAMLKMLQDETNVRLLTHTYVVGTVAEGDKVVGVVVVTPKGLATVRGKRIIDATGDADVAARAGAASTYGTRRDTLALWYSFAQYQGANSEARRHFAYAVDIRDPKDYTRAIIAGRRYKKSNNVTAPQYYFTPRETRRIDGKYHVDLYDCLAERRFEDLLFVCKSNFDIKGIGDSDLTFSGYVEWQRLRNYQVQVPYRAILPKSLENILVVGKSFSVSHDLQSLARMQRDMIAMGAAAGVVAARSVQDKTPLKAFDVTKLQWKLVDLGILEPADLEAIKGVKDNALPKLSPAELQERIDEIAAGKMDLGRAVQVLARPDETKPLLIKALKTAQGDGKVELARALCYLGHAGDGAPEVFLSELEKRLAGDQLPSITRLPTKRLAHPLPDHGFAPDPTYFINTLGRMKDKRVIPYLLNVAKKVEPEKDTTNRMYSYIYSVAYAAERLADPSCVEALRVLADKPGIRGGVVTVGSDPRRTARGTASRRDDRYAYLELCLGRALAHCGSERGYEILRAYANDIRGFLARSARDELKVLSEKASKK